MSSKEVKISVRELIEFVRKSGSLDDRYVSRTRAVDGTIAHQKLQKSNAKIYSDYEKEVFIRYNFKEEGYFITVEGRVDGIIKENDRIIIEEIKSTNRDLIYIDEDYNELHWLQGIFYGYMYCKNNSLDSIVIMLSYFHLETEEVKSFEKRFKIDELRKIVHELLDEYVKWVEWRNTYVAKRDETITKVVFPFKTYRKGQRELAVAWYNTIKENEQIFIQAPTGIGKTISTLFPAIKALGNGMGERIFYLTAKTITRTVAEEALIKLRDEGLQIKSVTISAKEKMCLNDKVSCNPDECEYARGYFDKINNVVYKSIQEHGEFTKDKILKIANENKLCPFELSLDLSIWCDVIIGDYNYAFDTRVRLSRFFEDEIGDNIILVDEAHNLVDRARGMYSSQLNKGEVNKLCKMVKGKSRRLYNALNDINKKFIDIRHEAEEKGEAKFYTEDEYSELYKSIRQGIIACDEFLVNNKGVEIYEEVLNLYFEMRKFISASELYDKDRYVTVVQLDKSDVIVKIFCFNPSENIKKTLKNAYASILFSATLSPINYYIDLLGGEKDGYRLTLPSPFRKENLKIINKNINIRYAERENTLDEVVNQIKDFVENNKGNNMIFAPSFQYLKILYDKYISQYGIENTIIQNSETTEQERNTFLDNFTMRNNLTAFCVIGGVFSEGIDLPGDKLVGVAVIGVGLPMITYEGNIIKDKFKKNGFDYAYVFPGINKIMQAVGRVIRTEEDIGKALLIDDRYSTSKYKSLLPNEWDIK